VRWVAGAADELDRRRRPGGPWRAKPALAFGGKFKIIDFTPSSCVNSGLPHHAVLTQYKSQGLTRHVTDAWAFLDAGRGEFIDAALIALDTHRRCNAAHIGGSHGPASPPQGRGGASY
jgi:ADP-glucose pyrophosphorylase